MLCSLSAAFPGHLDPGGDRSTLFVLLAIAVPLMTAGCLLPLRPIKGWLVASQFVNKAIEAGTEKLWSQMHARQDAERAGRDADSKAG